LKAISCFLVGLAVAFASPETNSNRLAAIERQIASPQVLGVADPSAPAKHLQRILSRPEFAESVHGPSAWERWKRQIDAWLSDRLSRIFKAAARHPATSQTVFWIAAVGAVGVIAFVLFRIFRRDEYTGYTSPVQNAISTTSRDWVRLARLAADAAQYNKAIQCLYWAAVLELQDEGLLPKSTGLTPRELVRAACSTAVGNELRKLTSALERFWYASMPASSADFTACMQYVDALRGKPE
jgi:hypothetical protein